MRLVKFWLKVGSNHLLLRALAKMRPSPPSDRYTRTWLSEQFTNIVSYSPQQPQFPSDLWSGPGLTGKSQSRPLPQDKVARVFAFLGSKNLWNLHQILIGFGRWLHVNEIFATQKDSEGNCIDILLLACLHKLYIWHRGGGEPNKTKTP